MAKTGRRRKELLMVELQALRGYVLEEVLARLLRRSGYRLLVRESQDPDALKGDKNVLLVRGRGANHQADALGELLIPTPFSFPIRLFAEAKFTKEAIGLGAVRNAVSVISDVNERYASDAKVKFPLRRHQYCYALFSVSGFTADAQKYALTRQISLIDLQGPAFAEMRAAAEGAAEQLVDLANRSGVDPIPFPLAQMRAVFRWELETWTVEERHNRMANDASPAGAADLADGQAAEGAHRLPSEDLAHIAEDLSDQLYGSLTFGFPQCPFILVLQPDNPGAFDAFLNKARDVIEVDIHYSGVGGTNGEWAIIIPQPRRKSLIVRFGIPPLLESWLLAVDGAETERAAQVRDAFFSTIGIFHHDNRLTQLRYRRVVRPESSVEEIFTTPIPALRRELASPDLAFKRRREQAEYRPWDYADLGPPHVVGRSVPPQILQKVRRAVEAASTEPWTADGARELMRRLEQERRVQAAVIQVAAQHEGRIPRQVIYDLAGYKNSRSLRGFTRPVSRITKQLQSEGLVAGGVAPALASRYKDGRVAHFVVPPDVWQVLRT